MRERPILFSAPMVRAILDGRKTQTRRVVKMPSNVNAPIVARWHQGKYYDHGTKTGFVPLNENGGIATKAFDDHHIDCPYGVPGDRLWVRETWWTYPHVISNRLLRDGADTWPKVNGEPIAYAADGDADIWSHLNWIKKPSIFMPRWASRLTLEITRIRVERLQGISPADARAEGIASVEFTEAQERRMCQRRSAAQFHGKPELVNDMDYAAVQKYAVLWDSINGKKHPWVSNPWVWVISFRKIS